MNHTYRVVWNSVMQTWQAAAECARRRGKSQSIKPASIAVAASLALAGTGHALAVGPLPTGGKVVAGQGSIHQNGNAMTINQSSNKLAVEWQSFSVGKNNTVNFVQPSASAVALNRVLGSDISAIQGAINANGQVFLINPNGVLFSPTAQVNVGSLVASTLNMSNADFMAGNYQFGGNSSNAVVNQGALTATGRGGSLVLIAAKVTNEGTLSAQSGNVLLAAGREITLDLGGPVKLRVTQGALDALVANGGAIMADGGVVVLTAQAVNTLTTATLNNTGVIRAQTLATGEKGEIKLLADMTHGQVNVGGALDASAPVGGNGGFIETSAAKVNIQPGVRVSASAAAGKSGEWLVDPTNITIDTTAAQTYSDTLNTGTDVTVSTASAGADAGDITVSSAISKTAGSAATLTLRADRNINVDADITSISSRPNIVLDAANGASATSGGVKINANLSSNGGNIIIGGGSLVTKNTLQTTLTSNDIDYALNHSGFTDGTKTVTAAISVLGGKSIMSSGGDIVMNGKTTATASNLSGGLDKAGIRFSTGTTAAPTLIDAGGGNLVLSGVSTASDKVWGISFLGGATGDLIKIQTGTQRGHLVLDAVNSADSTAALSMQQSGGRETVMFFMPSVAHLLPLLNGSLDVASYTYKGQLNPGDYPYSGTLEIPGSNSSYKYALYNVTTAPTLPIYGIFDGTRQYDGTTNVPRTPTDTLTTVSYLNDPVGYATAYPTSDLSFATYNKNAGSYNALAISYNGLTSGSPPAPVTNPLSPVPYSGNNYSVEFFGTYKITPKTITPTPTNKVYDGSNSAALSAAGLIGTDSVTFNPGTAVFTAGKNVGTGLAVSGSGLSLTGDDAGNYTLSSTSVAGTANITARPLGIQVSGAYNGTTTFGVSAVTTSANGTGTGLVSGETINQVTINSANVADNSTNYVTNATGAGGFLLSNYAISGSRTVNNLGGGAIGNTNNTVSLTKAALGLDLLAIYNGSTSFTIDNTGTLTTTNAVIETTGLVNGETITGVTVSGLNVAHNGGNTVTAATGAGGFDINNYQLGNS